MSLTNCCRRAVTRRACTALIACTASAAAGGLTMHSSLAASPKSDAAAKTAVSDSDSNLGSVSNSGSGPAEPASDASRGQLVLVMGAAGTPEYQQEFQNDAQRWAELARLRGLDLVRVEQRDQPEQAAKYDEEKRAEPNADKLAGQSQREQLQATLAAADKFDTTPLWIVLIGHGTSERGIHKFNLVGPDVSSKELSDWLKELQGRRVIVIDCSSASAPFLPELSGPNRVIVTATRSGSENNYSRFGTQLAASILDAGTDIDHDEEVSLLEAFLAASAKTEKFYREQNRLATEHALIDDNGDKLGTGAEFFRGTRAVKAAQAGKQLDGEVAARLILSSADTAPKLTAEQEAKRGLIESQIEQLRASKPSPPADSYWNELEKLLLELAEVYEGE